MRQILEGMLYLHSYGILHRDLTLANLLLTKDMDVVSAVTIVTYLIQQIYFYFLHKN